ncbi:TM0106 family RecB-like putative nuclease [Candidatus Bipolaricaulota bacterium]|nr:TM0106 family RecB-like putative nuclease [Candidatus Bipolaricaulota bacterium]
MKLHNSSLRLSASDLANHLGCRHLTFLDLCVVRKDLTAPSYRDPALEALQERGFQHEKAYIEHLRSHGLSIVELPELGDLQAQYEATCAAMRDGPDVIVQAALLSHGWMGRADILQRVASPSDLGAYSYEVADTKLARETKGRTILQLCLYSDILRELQGTLPEAMHVVPPGVDFIPETHRVDDYMAYYRLVRSRLLETVGAGAWSGSETYPDPCEQCDICRWWHVCDTRRHDDDHLSLVANISKRQIVELQELEIDTLESLATVQLPLVPTPAHGAPETYERVHHQARVQLEGRTKGQPIHELLPLEDDFGLFRLPEPTSEDIFFDFEGARFVGDEGLEYLFGFVSLDNGSEPQYESLWGLTVAEEKLAFEQFIDDVMARWETDQGFHIYHYAPYEPSAIKRLMGRHATREEEVDRLLRGERFVDLYAVVRQSLRASVEKYSIKDLEPFFGYERDVDLRAATRNIQALEYVLEFDTPESIPKNVLDAVEGYNRDDCLSTLKLRDWLEGLRAEVVKAGHTIPRPEHSDGMPSEALDEELTRARELAEQLTRDIPADRHERTSEQQAQWILAQLLEWHRREDKALWWEYYRLIDLSDEELRDERVAIAGLQFVERMGMIKRSFVDRYRFPAQETEVRVGDKPKRLEEEVKGFGEVVAIDAAARTIDIKKGPKIENQHAATIFVHDVVKTYVLRDALLRIGEWVAENGIDADGPYRAGRDLLIGNPPRLATSPIAEIIDGSPTELDAARKLVLDLDGGLLPIQGPPGSGKTFTGGRMICEAMKAGLKVGITAVSHKVIRNLLNSAVEAAEEAGLDLRCVQKVSKISAEPPASIVETKDNGKVFSMLESREAQVAAGTAWLWTREEAEGAIDILFVDEAGQISLANTVAVSQAAKSVVLLGDPQQLEQPKRGSHPDGTDVSALEHLLGEHQTMPPDRGLFLATTWRLHPSICEFTSELFYEGRLHSRDGLDVQSILGKSDYTDSGLFFVPVEHEGNCNESPEEAEVVASLVRELTAKGMKWINQKEEVAPLTLDDVLVVAPYNAHVASILERLPDGARVGTVDRFQGQEAPVVIYSMGSSSPEDAPRGMEFLYSLSRFNVATSRARCICILVANPKLFEPECRTPQQMKLANAFCRYLEMSSSVDS